MISKADITGIILCGGRGARLNGLDKPLIELGKKRIIDCMLERLRAQVHEVVLSCSRNVALYEALGHPVVVDGEPSEGPIAGLHESFAHATTEWVLTSPGDIPFISTTLVERLQKDAQRQGIAVPTIQGHQQNLCMLLSKKRRDSLDTFYLAGGRAVKEWLRQCEIPATDLTDLAQDFLNVNTIKELNEARFRITTDPESEN